MQELCAICILEIKRQGKKTFGNVNYYFQYLKSIFLAFIYTCFPLKLLFINDSW